MSKTILLTGGTGFLGGHLGYQFLKRGCHVVYLARGQRSKSAIDRVTTLLQRLDPEYARNCPGTFDVCEGDVAHPHLFRDDSTLRAWEGKIDEVWHSAAVLHFRDTYETLSQAVNLNGTVNVLNAAHRLGVPRFHHISTAYVSGKGPTKVFERQSSHDYDFRNPYERTKYDAELEVRKKGRQYELATTIYRPAVIVGDSKTGETMSFSGFYSIAKMFHLMKRVLAHRIKTKGNPDVFREKGVYLDGETLHFPLKFPCSRNSTVNLVPIDYVVDTILKLADEESSAGQTYHITNPHPPKIVELLSEGCRMFQLDDIEFVDCSFANALGLIHEEIRHYARMGLNISFCLEIAEYIHYLFGEPDFDIANVRRTLKSSFVEPPRITPSFTRMLLAYASGCQWKCTMP